MLTIRMQRNGRKGHAMFRVVVQDSRRSPTSGKVVARLGNYDPHTKVVNITKDKIKFYLEHGAQPSERVARLLKSEGVTLPKWVTISSKDPRKIRSPEKLRKNRSEVVETETPSEEEVKTETESNNDEVSNPDVPKDKSEETPAPATEPAVSDESKTEDGEVESAEADVKDVSENKDIEQPKA